MPDFSALYQRYAPDVFRFALYLSGNHSDAEDITSETFVRAFASAEPIDMATVKGYLFKIARNLFLHGLRRSSRQTDLPVDLRDLQPSAYTRAEQKAELGAVLGRLQALREVDRAALLMRTLDELPYEEIAQVLKISVGAAKLKVDRARAALLEIRQ